MVVGDHDFIAGQAAGSRDTAALARARAAEMSGNDPAALDSRRAQQLAEKLALAQQAISDD